MRLEPIYLLASGSKPRVSRRAVLGCAISALGGIAAGWWLGARRFVEPVAAEVIDEELRWAIDRVEGPIDQLVTQHQHFLLVLNRRLADRHRLWPGVVRLAETAVSAAGAADLDVAARRVLAERLVQTIENVVPHPAHLDRLVPDLRRVR
jgi:hypothetical protein